jgi:hypothetical protein
MYLKYLSMDASTYGESINLLSSIRMVSIVLSLFHWDKQGSLEGSTFSISVLDPMRSLCTSLPFLSSGPHTAG